MDYFAGKTTILYNVDLSDIPEGTTGSPNSDDVIDVGFTIVGNNPKIWIKELDLNFDIPIEQRIENNNLPDNIIEQKIRDNTLSQSYRNIQLLGKHQGNKYLVAIKNCTPGSTIRISPIKKLQDGTIEYESYILVKLLNDSGEKIKVINLLSGYSLQQDDINRVVEILNEITTIQHDIELSVDSGGWWWKGGANEYYLSYLNVADIVKYTTIMYLIVYGLMSHLSNSTDVRNYMEFATGYKNAYWIWRSNGRNYPVLGSEHVGYNKTCDAWLYKMAAGLQTSRGALKYYMYNVTPTDPDKKYYALYINGKYIFLLPTLKNPFVYSNIPYSEDYNMDDPINFIEEGENGGTEINGMFWNLTYNNIPFQMTYDYITYVDLGLPSGTLWSSVNFGASYMGDLGYQFAWGDPTFKTSFTLNNYKYYNGTEYTKYDANALMDNSDDISAKFTGNSYSIPTQAQWEELKNECDYQRIGNDWYIFTGPNGNKLIIPMGTYWTKNLSTDKSKGIAYQTRPFTLIEVNRYEGCYIRPIYIGNNTGYSVSVMDRDLEFIRAIYKNEGTKTGISLTASLKEYLLNVLARNDLRRSNYLSILLEDFEQEVLDYNTWYTEEVDAEKLFSSETVSGHYIGKHPAFGIYADNDVITLNVKSSTNHTYTFYIDDYAEVFLIDKDDNFINSKL